VRTAEATVAEYPADGPGDRLALILTGDDGVTTTIASLANHLARAGVPSVVLTPAAASETPDAAGASMDRIARAHLKAWSRDRLLLLGTARGASITPFVANRIGRDLRDRVEGIVLFGLQSRVSFTRRWHQLWRQTPSPTDLPVLPELERLRGLPILCLYRDPARDSFCSSLDPTLAQRELAPARADGESEGAALAARVTRMLPTVTRAAP
jgi:type IV secretory pathway VirJ component